MHLQWNAVKSFYEQSRQSKLWQLVEGNASVSQSARGDSGIVCCFAFGALVGIALLLVLSGRVLAGILVLKNYNFKK